MLESSKSFAKDVMAKAGVPTGRSETFSTSEAARSQLEKLEPPFVVKADGLAGGKGVLVTESLDDAIAWASRWVEEGPVVVEEFLDGPEVSVFAVCTDQGAVTLEPARDYKRLLDGDRGPNTGGMGSYSPVDDLPKGLESWTLDNVVQPILNQMDEDEIPFRGFLYTGLVLTATGPKVLEFNVRLGDPETQAVLPRLESDLLDVLEGARPVWSDLATVNVVLAARGYPESPEKGVPIGGLRQAATDDVLVFHAGTRSEDGKIVVDGGRVVNIVGTGPDVATARSRAYEAVEKVSWPGVQYRTDIAG